MIEAIDSEKLDTERFVETQVAEIRDAVREGTAINALSGGVNVEIIDARREFFSALKGITDLEAKREAVTQTFYRDVFGRTVLESSAWHLLQGTILTDVNETVAGIERQHNVFAQLGIDPKKTFGFHILEPVIQLRNDGVRKVGKTLGLPAAIADRMPWRCPQRFADRSSHVDASGACGRNNQGNARSRDSHLQYRDQTAVNH